METTGGGTVADRHVQERINYYVERGALIYPRNPLTQHEDTAFAYVPGELIIAEGDRTTVERQLGGISQGRGRRPVPPDLGTVRISGDPHEVARNLVDKGGRRLAAPHMLLTLGTHYGWGSADDPEPAGPLGPPTGSLKVPARVAVVDTGMFEPAPAGLGVGIIENDPIDVRAPYGFVDWFGAGHGGFIAGVIDHRAHGAVIDVYRGFDSSVSLPTEMAIIEGVDRAIAGGATAVNVSAGTYGFYGDPPLGLVNAMRRWKADHPGLLIVAAAGNDGILEPWYPAGFAGDGEFAGMVVSVGALDPAGNRAIFSNYGEWVKAWAPGVGVHSHYPKAKKFQSSDGTIFYFTDGFACWSGTSFAAPRALAGILRHAEAMGGVDPVTAWTDLLASGQTTF